jgi:outer membrane protein OmpA-like peptidoglycan-associated protein
MRSQCAVLLPILVVVSLIGAGCATKQWVHDQMGQERVQTASQMTELNARVGREAKRLDQTAARVNELEKSVEVVNRSVEGVNRSVEVVNRSVEQLTRSTQTAHERADSAFSRAEQGDQRLTHLWRKRNDEQLVEAVEVLFKSNRADLDDAAQTTLLRVVRELRENRNLKVDLAGYADPYGTRQYNLQLSQWRVDVVQRFLVQQGVELSRISAIGLGVLPGAGISNDKKRRVTVRLMIAAAE